MTRRPVPDHEKRQNIGLRLHPITIERLDEIAAFFKKLRELNPLLPFRYPESRTEVIEWMLREGAIDVMRRVQAWSRLGTPAMKPNDLDFMASTPFWNMLLTEVRRMHEAIPESWLEPSGPFAPFSPLQTAQNPASVPAAPVEPVEERSPRAPKAPRRKRIPSEK